ncbi:MAG: glycosyltransferase family 4 protein [Gammaproteobacteria bacterium]|jgi:glycosyltransferase involved in cell wall biosynthesis|nr:glycosyltransferase family 4 protein [Gammaproteobacteria bacterium]
MRIAMIGDFPRDPAHIAGGVESVMANLTEGLSRFEDIVLDIVTVDRWGLGARETDEGFGTVHYLAASTRPGRLKIRQDIDTMTAELVRLKPDLAHAHIAGKYSAAADASGIPWILTLHGIRFLEARLKKGLRDRTWGRWLVTREEMRSVGRASHVISISPFIGDSFGGRLRGKVYDIENPVSDTYFGLAGTDEDNTLLYAGRLTPRKGIDTLLRGFARLHDERPEVRLHLAGSFDKAVNDPYAERIHAIVEEEGLHEVVDFLGLLGEQRLLEEFARCSALVLSPILETAPMVIAQAMAAGKPVIATDVGGNRYMVADGASGFIVPDNDVEQLSDAMRKVMEDPQRRAEMGRHGKELAERRFRIRSVAERTRLAYYDALGRTPRD